MSSKEAKNNHLYSLQKAIIMYLAKNGPQTKHKTAEDIKHSYHPSHFAFTALEQKGIIRKGKTKEYNGRKFPLYWLTEEGVILALTEGIPPTDLLANTKQVYPDNQMLQLALDLAPYFNVEIFKIFLTALRTKGRLEPVDLVSIMVTQMQTPASMKTFTQALNNFRKYPKEYSQFKKDMILRRENFNKLTEKI